MQTNTKPLTKDEIETAASLLSRQPAGFLPLPLFLQIMRLAVASIVEIVPLRMSVAGKVQVLLIEREDSYGLWPDTLHTPGVVVRPTDQANNYKDAFSRILDEELKGTQISEPPSFSHYTLHKSKRGMENALVFYAEVTGDPIVGSFYDADNLPANIMESQRDFIIEAANYYKKQKINKKS